VNKKILVLGGGVAGSSIAYYLSEKGYDVTVIEKHSRVGGLARTCYYSGHPYEFGPHIWFWPGGEADPINHTIASLTGGDCCTSIGAFSPTSRPTDASTAIRCTIRTSTRCRSARRFMTRSGCIATNS
jgi:flavin-dependent dehydrogenase